MDEALYISPPIHRSNTIRFEPYDVANLRLWPTRITNSCAYVYLCEYGVFIYTICTYIADDVVAVGLCYKTLNCSLCASIIVVVTAVVVVVLRMRAFDLIHLPLISFGKKSDPSSCSRSSTLYST